MVDVFPSIHCLFFSCFQLSDYALVREDNKQFNEYLSINPPASPRIDMSVFVMTKGSWPSYISHDLCLPSEMVSCFEMFDTL